jgi:hypothetical protein
MTAMEATVASGAVVSALDALYTRIDEVLAHDGIEAVGAEVITRLNTLGVKLYAAARAAEVQTPPVMTGEAVTATEAAVFCSDLLATVNLDLFELSLWRGMGRA